MVNENFESHGFQYVDKKQTLEAVPGFGVRITICNHSFKNTYSFTPQKINTNGEGKEKISAKNKYDRLV